jgi:signal transduction histidine kinase/ligand-binding sensor domain-containing protein
LVKCWYLIGNWFLLALLVCVPQDVRASQPAGALRELVVRSWTKADGLPNAAVTSILQSREGYLWIGTGAGLVRFDGATFRGVPLQETVSNIVLSVTSLYEDGSGRLWVGSQNHGLFCIADGATTHYGKDSGLAHDNVTSLAMDAERRLWVGTPSGACRLDGRRFTCFTTSDGLPDDVIIGLHRARSGAVWITTRAGVCKFDKNRIHAGDFSNSGGRATEFMGVYEDIKSNLWAFGATFLINRTEEKRFNYFYAKEPTSVRIWSLCEGRDGRLWIGTSGRGVFWFDGSRFQPVQLADDRCPNDVRAICEDREGNLWLGSAEGGLTRFHTQSYMVFGSKQALPHGAAVCLGLDPIRRVTVGMESGGIYANQGERFESLSERTGLPSQELVSSVCAGLDGALWAGTWSSGLYGARSGRTVHYGTAQGLWDDSVAALCADTDGTLWIGTQSGGLQRLRHGALTTFQPSQGWPMIPVTSLAPKRAGGVWIATASGVLFLGTSNRVQRISAPQELLWKTISCLYEDQRGRLWLGTIEGRFGCLHSGEFTVWSSALGVPQEAIAGIVDDAESNLWLLTRGGVYRTTATSTTNTIVGSNPPQFRLMFEMGSADGRAAYANATRVIRSPEGLLWFATSQGLVAADPRGWAGDRSPPPVRLEAVLVNSKPLATALVQNSADPQNRVLTLPANLQALEVQFTALDLAAPERVRFRHKLGGFDADWVDSGPERRVRYGRLAPGRYDFHVTARNSDSDWNVAGASFSFVVPTPVWRAPWALALYGTLLTAAVVAVVRLVSHRRLRHKLARLQHQQSMERERVRIAQDMHDEIGSKLTKISFLSERAKVELRDAGPVAGKIDAIADTSRDLLLALDEIVWAVNPRNDTLEHLADYLAQYAAEYFQDTTVECDLRLQGEIPRLPMSAETRHNLFLAFEEALNNVLKHSGASEVHIDIRADHDQLRISIEDNGKGFAYAANSASQKPPNSTGGNGVPNMCQRLTEISGACHIRSAPGAGTSIVLTIPLNLPAFQPA